MRWIRPFCEYSEDTPNSKDDRELDYSLFLCKYTGSAFTPKIRNRPASLTASSRPSSNILQVGRPPHRRIRFSEEERPVAHGPFKVDIVVIFLTCVVVAVKPLKDIEVGRA